MINASNKPYARATYHLEDAKLVVWGAEIVADDAIYSAVPRQVCEIGDEVIEIVCDTDELSCLKIETNKANI